MRHNDGQDVDGSGPCTVRQRGPSSDRPSPPLSNGIARSGGPPTAPKTLGWSQRGTAWSRIERRTPTKRHCGWCRTTSLPQCAAREPGGDARPPATPPPPLKSFWVRWRTACHLQIAVRVPVQGPRAIPFDPPPPPEALKQCGAACYLKISMWVWDQGARAISFNRPPLPSEALYQWWAARHNLATAWS